MAPLSSQQPYKPLQNLIAHPTVVQVSWNRIKPQKTTFDPLKTDALIPHESACGITAMKPFQFVLDLAHADVTMPKEGADYRSGHEIF